jgi:PPOX class probable F420-dependent enzyme
MRLPEDLKALLDGPNIAHLATLDPDGSPHVTAMWVMRDGDHIVFNTLEGRRKWHNMRADPRVAVSISPADEAYVNFSIQGEVIEMRTSDGRAVIDDLARQYHGTDGATFVQPEDVRVTVIVAATRVATN